MERNTDKYWVTEFNYMDEVMQMCDHLPEKVSIYDNTLREGDQTPGCIMRTEEKLALAHDLDDLGVDFIEIFPAVSPDDAEALRELCKPGVLKHAKMSALVRPDTGDLELANDCGCKHIFLEGPGNMDLAGAMLGVTDEDAYINMYVKTAQKAKEYGMGITACPWDIGKAPMALVEKWVKRLAAAGVDDIAYGDTFGFTMPWAVQYMVKKYREWAGPDVIISCHFHNDYGLATANTLAAVSAGASRVQVAMNNIGERAGNTPLDEVVVNLNLNMGVKTDIKLEKLYSISRRIEKITRFPIARNKPILGEHVFDMGSGILVDVLKKLENNGGKPHIILPFDPSLVGRPPYRVVWGKGAGRTMVRNKLESMGLTADKDQIKEILLAIKEEALITKNLLSETDVETLINNILKK